MSNLDKLLTEFKDARSAASKVPWSLLKDKDGDTERIFASDITGCDEEDNTYHQVGIIELPVEKYGYGSAWASEPNGEFICLAANNSAKLIKIIEVMKLALKEECYCYKNTECSCCEALQQAEQIAGENE